MSQHNASTKIPDLKRSWHQDLNEDAESLFENKSLIKTRTVFWYCRFLKMRCLLKLFGKSFTKNFYNFRILWNLTFQKIGQRLKCSRFLLMGHFKCSLY